MYIQTTYYHRVSSPDSPLLTCTSQVSTDVLPQVQTQEAVLAMRMSSFSKSTLVWPMRCDGRCSCSGWWLWLGLWTNWYVEHISYYSFIYHTTMICLVIMHHLQYHNEKHIVIFFMFLKQCRHQSVVLPQCPAKTLLKFVF